MSQKVLRTQTVYRGRIVHLDLETVRLPNGVEVTLEVVHHSGAAAVVPLLPDGRVVLVYQYRHAAGGYIWEVPAGRLEPGEPPEACARRELAEEVGYRAGRLEKLGVILTTPGFCDEAIHLFVARDLDPCPVNHEADEVLEIRPKTMQEAMTMIHRGEIRDAKSVAALQETWLRLAGPEAGAGGEPTAG